MDDTIDRAGGVVKKTGILRLTLTTRNMEHDMIIGVTGGRKYEEYEVVAKVLDHFNPDIVVHGGCTGADSLADRWCKSRGKVSTAVYPNWDLGKIAGPIRNNRILAEFKPEAIVAFPGHTGTLDMVTKAKTLGTRVYFGVDVWTELRGEEAVEW